MNASDANRALQEVRSKISKACESVSRSPDDVTLVVVSKTRSADAIRAYYDLGVRDFGESRLQEALPKIELLPKDIRWHFIGRLQSNKARRAAENFATLHTLETVPQLVEIGKGKTIVDGLIEVNVAEEPQKSGVIPKSLDAYLDQVLQCPQVRFRGLMTIGPAGLAPEQSRPYFRRLREMTERVGGRWISMGMSSDYEAAIQEGSTHIRIGSALFGERK